MFKIKDKLFLYRKGLGSKHIQYIIIIMIKEWSFHNYHHTGEEKKEERYYFLHKRKLVI